MIRYRTLTTLSMDFFKTLIEMCLFQAKPEDLPYSQNALLITGVALAVGIYLTLPPEEGTNSILTSVLHVLAYAVAIWGALKLNSKSERFVQTMTALLGTAAIFQFVTWPVAGWLFKARETPEEQIPLLAVLILGVWTFAVAVYIVRRSLESTIGMSIVITLACQMFAASIILLMFGRLMI